MQADNGQYTILPKQSNEIWAVVPFEPDFEASTMGRVRRAKASTAHPAGYVLRQYDHQKGYRVVKMRGRPYYVHRAVAAAFVSPCITGMVVNHKDGCKTNNCVDNLEVITSAENTKHAHATGLTARSPLWAVADELFAMRQEGLSQRKIAERLGVTRGAVKGVLERGDKRDNWKSIGDLARKIVEGK